MAQFLQPSVGLGNLTTSRFGRHNITCTYTNNTEFKNCYCNNIIEGAHNFTFWPGNNCSYTTNIILVWLLMVGICSILLRMVMVAIHIYKTYRNQEERITLV
jgi:hypothetical protein